MARWWRHVCNGEADDYDHHDVVGDNMFCFLATNVLSGQRLLGKLHRMPVHFEDAAHAESTKRFMLAMLFFTETSASSNLFFESFTAVICSSVGVWSFAKASSMV